MNISQEVSVEFYAYLEGQKAFYNGGSHVANPYDYGTQEFRAFRQGFMSEGRRALQPNPEASAVTFNSCYLGSREIQL